MSPGATRVADHPTRDGLDLLDGGFYAGDPHEAWTWMRREAPVYYDEASDVWGITRYDDVLAIEKDPVTFSSTGAPRPHLSVFPMMISMDDPEHRRSRGLIHRGFTPRRVADMEPRIADLCRRIVDGVAEAGSCDLVWDIAAPLPLMVIADLLGFNAERHADLLRWSDDMMRATTAEPTVEQAVVAADALAAFQSLQLDVIARRRAAPGDDLISVLCEAEIDGERLDDESIVSEALLLLIGGDETTRHVIPAGDQIINLYPSANRDEDVFVAADAFDVRRDPNPHLAFGFGPHFCLGAALARLELRCMLDEVLPRLHDLRLTVDEVAVRPSNFVSGLESMPVEFTHVEPARDGRRRGR